MPTLSAHDARKLAVIACVHPKTVARAYRGDDVRSTTRARILVAAKALGFALPPRVLL